MVLRSSFVPGGTRSPNPLDPALKRWAIFTCPSGTKHRPFIESRRRAAGPIHESVAADMRRLCSIGSLQSEPPTPKMAWERRRSQAGDGEHKQFPGIFTPFG